MEHWFTIEMAVALAGTGLAGIVRGFSGFGLALVLVPTLGLVYGPAPAVVVTLLLQAVSTVQMLPGSVRHCDLRLIGTMGLAATVTVPVGAWLLVVLDPALTRRIISVFVLLCAAALVLGWRYRKRPRLIVTLAVAAFSGLSGGLTSISGPPVVIYLYSGPDSARRNRHNLVVYFAILNAVGIVAYAANGLLTVASLWRAVLLTPVLYLGVHVGSRLYMRASEVMLRRAAVALIAIIAVAGLFK